jgi:alpha-glucosidase
MLELRALFHIRANHVDFAATHGLDYIHFDTGWYGDENAPESDPFTVASGPVNKYGDTVRIDLDLPAVVGYAERHDVGVILYVNHLALAKQRLGRAFCDLP